MTIHFTWDDFDKSIDYIEEKCFDRRFSGIYGIPRGGLCLAVALSHRLNIKLIKKPIKDSLIVDDIYETGFTLNPFRDVEGATFFVLFSKESPIWWNAANLAHKNEWIIFPWENKKNIYNDQKEYKIKRKMF